MKYFLRSVSIAWWAWRKELVVNARLEWRYGIGASIRRSMNG